MTYHLKIFPCKSYTGKHPVVDIHFFWIPRTNEPVLLLDQHGNFWRMFRAWPDAQKVYPSAQLTAPLVVRLDEQKIACPVGHCVRVAVPMSSDFPMMQDAVFKQLSETPVSAPPYWNEVGLSKMSRVLFFTNGSVAIPVKEQAAALLDYLSKLKSTTVETDSIQSNLLKNLGRFTWNGGKIQLAECSLSKGLLWIVEDGEPAKAAELKGSTYTIVSTLVAAAFEQNAVVVFGQDKDGDALLTAYSMADLGIETHGVISVGGKSGTKPKKAKAPESEEPDGLTEKMMMLLPKKHGAVSKFQNGVSKLDL